MSSRFVPVAIQVMLLRGEMGPGHSDTDDGGREELPEMRLLGMDWEGLVATYRDRVVVFGLP